MSTVGVNTATSRLACWSPLEARTQRKMPGFLYTSQPPTTAIDLCILDKDGTVLDFNATWLPAFKEAASMVAAECGEPGLAPALLKVGGWVDGANGPYIAHDGILLHGTLAQLAQTWIDTQPIVASHYEKDAARIEKLVDEVLLESTVRDACPLGNVEPTLRTLRDAGVQLAIVTNDQEAIAKAQLSRLGWMEYFTIVIGADSGHGAKPGPGGVRAAIEAAGVPAERAIMVGDAEADQLAGRSAGCAFTVAIWPDGEPLPQSMASAACRMETIAALPEVLAAAGQISLEPSPVGGSGGSCGGTVDAGPQTASEAEVRAGATAAAAIDPAVIAMVESSNTTAAGEVPF